MKDPSGTLSGKNEDGSESFESESESHNPCNESNINRVMENFKSEVMGELLEIKRELKKKDEMNFHELLAIKREMKKKDNIILDLLGCLDANQGQQNGQTRQSTNPVSPVPRSFNLRDQIRDNKLPKQIKANRDYTDIDDKKFCK